MLERKYASQFAKPELQLQVNASTSTTNQTLVITTEQAADFKTRNASIDAELSKLSPPARRQDMLAEAIARDSQSSLGASASIDASLAPNKEGTGGTPAPVPL